MWGSSSGAPQEAGWEEEGAAGGAQLWVDEGGRDATVPGAPGTTEAGGGPEGCCPVGARIWKAARSPGRR